MWQHKASSVISREVALATEALNTDSGLNHRPCHQHADLVDDLTHTVTIISRAVATFEATEAAASVVFMTVASVKTITSTSQILHLTATIILP